MSYINAGDAKVSGVDFAADWRPNLDIPGQFGINFLFTKLLDLETQATATSPVVDWVGTLGPDPATSLNNGAFDYRIFTTVSYLIEDWSVSLRWRHLPTAEAAQEATVVGPVANLGAQEDYDVFDLSATWQVNDRTRLRMGIDNVLDTDPVITGGRNTSTRTRRRAKGRRRPGSTTSSAGRSSSGSKPTSDNGLGRTGAAAGFGSPPQRQGPCASTPAQWRLVCRSTYGSAAFSVARGIGAPSGSIEAMIRAVRGSRGTNINTRRNGQSSGT